MSSTDLERVDEARHALERHYGGHVLAWANVPVQGAATTTYGASWQDPEDDAGPVIEVDERPTAQQAVQDLADELDGWTPLI